MPPGIRAPGNTPLRVPGAVSHRSPGDVAFKSKYPNRLKAGELNSFKSKHSDT